jgi:uncharacterized protein Yka (UPF0111/DUF47 family)
MNPREQLYRFEPLDTASAIILQQAIELRKTNITQEGSEQLSKSDKILKAVIYELDQMYDDLDRHIAHNVRVESYKSQVKAIEGRDQALQGR